MADFGRSGAGDYEELRDEYLTLYGNEQATTEIKELVNWFGSYLVERENTGSGHQYMNEYLPPQLDRLLVHTEIVVRDEPFIVHLPASLDREQIAGISEELTNLQLDQDHALQAFLSLPDVDANTAMIMESFEEAFVGTFLTIEDAVHGFCEIEEWEGEVNEFAAKRGLFIGQYTVDYEALADRLREIYDLVQWKDRVHVFTK